MHGAPRRAQGSTSRICTMKIMRRCHRSSLRVRRGNAAGEIHRRRLCAHMRCIPTPALPGSGSNGRRRILPPSQPASRRLPCIVTVPRSPPAVNCAPNFPNPRPLVWLQGEGNRCLWHAKGSARAWHACDSRGALPYAVAHLTTAITALQSEQATIDRELATLTRQGEAMARLRTIPGIGPVTAAAVAV